MTKQFIMILMLTVSTVSVAQASRCGPEGIIQVNTVDVDVKKTALIVRFDKPVEKTDYETLLVENASHPLIKASQGYLKGDGAGIEKTDLDHNKAIVEKGLAPHYGSRVNNVLSLKMFIGLTKTFPHSVGNTFPMNQRIVNVRNLYQLKSGPRKGCYLGANIFDFTDALSKGGEQTYIGTEAPYDKSDYYRMVIDTDARLLVSVTTDKDDSHLGAFPKIRNNIPVTIHHLAKDEELEIDGHNVKEMGTEVKKFASGRSIGLKTLLVSNEKGTKILKHIICRHWPDGGLGNSGEEISELIKTIINCESEVASRAHNPIVVNCGYGYGRTAIVILMHQIAKLIPADSHNYDPTQIHVEMEPMLVAIEGKIADASPIGLMGEGSEKRAADLRLLAQDMVSRLIH